MLQLQTSDKKALPLFHDSIVLVRLALALFTRFVLTYLCTRSFAHAIPSIVTRRSAVVIGLKIYENTSPYLRRCPDFLVLFGLYSKESAYWVTSQNANSYWRFPQYHNLTYMCSFFVLE